MENEIEYLQPVLGFTHLERFKPLTTFKAAIFHLIITIILEFAAVLFVIPSLGFISKLDLFYIILFGQTAYWFISVIFDHYYKWRHNFLRLDGHFEFHERSIKYATRPFYIISFWNAILLATLGILNMYTSFDLICTESNLLSAINVLSLIITLEAVMVIPLNITYMLCVHNFNHSRPKPDVEKRECWIADDSLAAGEVGYRGKGEAIANLLQEQADLIYYYKSLNDALNTKILELSAQIRGGS